MSVRHKGGPESGLLSNTRNWIVGGDTCAVKSRDFTGKGNAGGAQQGKGTQEDCSATCLTVSGFMGMGLVSRLSVANHSDSGSFLVAHASLGQDGFQQGGFWEIGRTYSISLWPFLNSSSWWWLITSVFLTRISYRKTTHAKGYYGAWPGWVVSISMLPLTVLWSIS